MPLILGTNSIKDTGYDVANSCRFDDGSSDALIRTLADPGGAGNRNKWTFSTWLKRGTLGTTQWIFGSYQNSNYYTYIRFKNDKLDFADLYNGSFNGRRETNRLFRDPSAWMHLVFIWDKDNSTTSEKMRIYVNGVEETSFATSSAPSNATTLNADGQDISIGQQEGVELILMVIFVKQFSMMDKHTQQIIMDNLILIVQQYGNLKMYQD